MWDIVWSVLLSLLLLGVMVWVHELGHFWAAKKTRIAVQTFSIGFGPALWKRTRKGVTYALRAFPFGGYVQFYDEEDGAPNLRAFARAKPWRRLITVLSGATANLLLAILLATVFLAAYGEYSPAIGGVQAGSPAAQAGLQSGDVITSVEGVTTLYSSQAYSEIALARQANKQDIHVTWNRADGSAHEAQIAFYTDDAAEMRRIGIEFNPQRIRYTVWEAFTHSFGWVLYLIGQMLSVLGGLFTGATQGANFVSAVGMVETMSVAARSSMESILRICTLLSANLGLVNLIPFPGLDGFRAATTGIEWVRKKPITPKWEARINMAGLVLLMGLSVLLIGQDVLRLFSNGTALP